MFFLEFFYFKYLFSGVLVTHLHCDKVFAQDINQCSFLFKMNILFKQNKEKEERGKNQLN